MRIFKDTILRLPPQAYENWAVIRCVEQFSPNYDTGSFTDKIIACNDAVWKDVAGVQLSYLKGYLSGGPVCFSCDLTKLTKDVRNALKEHIAQVKADTDFWMHMEVRILTDTPTMLALQYADANLKKVVVQAFDNNAHQKTLSIYPVVDRNKTYRVGDNSVTGSVIMDEGLTLDLVGFKEMTQIVLTAE